MEALILVMILLLTIVILAWYSYTHHLSIQRLHIRISELEHQIYTRFVEMKKDPKEGVAGPITSHLTTPGFTSG